MRSVRNHPTAPMDRLIHHPQRPPLLPGFVANRDNSPRDGTETGSLTYGPHLRLQLLSTPPHGDAVTFDYESVAGLDGDFHPAVWTPSRAHRFATLTASYGAGEAALRCQALAGQGPLYGISRMNRAARSATLPGATRTTRMPCCA